ncbi:leucyl aminopeptidase [Novosphingobium album (ex Hu et al. 2023)]|uniref:Probable cytosol aminopeptidase n=1 Tax=Novosphingobium album (ex Hu et al. 2023) TaxID=2930093 RepID=A0ABT0B365_9SPHN|nr:leucyl aminopeptidase [Novosphingobium album (ex Hu et al. 2023)]MCJ2179485.1 leucyl aminopeptidase [Novosphingobium album (ex Hu et al. 2023)]
MQIQFLDASAASSARLAARLVNKDAVPADLEPVLAEAAKMARFSGKAGQLFEGFVERDGKVVRVALAGVGAADAKDRKGAIEKAGAAIVAKYLTSGESSLTLDLTGAGLSAEEAGSALLGAVLRSWRHDVYRTKLADDKKPTLSEIGLAGAPEGTEALWEVEQAVAAGVAFTRELVTEPANTIYPESFVARCQAKMEGTGLKIRVLDEKEMAALGMGSLLGVAQGSVRPARLLVMEWLGGAEGDKPVAFVGKGVTFDTGGISLKPPAGMEDMKWDMGGAGAVAGTMLALALRKAKANVIGLCGLVENMPDGNAQRPGDVVTSMSGQTIEVINTDAEGRLVLCDALTWVQREYNPAKIVDLATLTGAIIAALAHEYAGLFSNNDDLAAALSAAGDATGDRLWRFPMGPAYDKQLDSAIADMKNVGSRFGGSITAAQFLKRFIENDTPWAHLDIAGTVWADKPGATWDKGATGFGVRLLDRFVRDTAEG